VPFKKNAEGLNKYLKFYPVTIESNLRQIIYIEAFKKWGDHEF
jgi:phage-related protein